MTKPGFRLTKTLRYFRDLRAHCPGVLTERHHGKLRHGDKTKKSLFPTIDMV
jgi:hypothetical protein